MSTLRLGEIAVIDDDVAVLDSLRFVLEVAGYPVATYSSAAAFLEDAEARPRCVILDYHMPAMNGLELATKLREGRRNLPILLISSALSPGILALAAGLDITKVLEKPPTEGELLGFVEESA